MQAPAVAVPHKTAVYLYGVGCTTAGPQALRPTVQNSRRCKNKNVPTIRRVHGMQGHS